jgi:hypothetical protein
VNLAKARASGTPVIHIQHEGTKGNPLEPMQRAGKSIRPSRRPITKRSSGSENQTRFSERRFSRSLKKEGLPTSLIERHQTPAYVQFTWSSCGTEFTYTADSDWVTVVLPGMRSCSRVYNRTFSWGLLGGKHSLTPCRRDKSGRRLARFRSETSMPHSSSSA